MLLAKNKLPDDYIDAGIGEAHVVRDALLSIFDVSAIDFPKDKSIFEYQEPQGYKPLVHLLEDKYQAPVIITTGAKQSLGAIMYALKQMGKTTISLPHPYWCVLPHLIEMHGLQWKSTYEGCDARLLVMPNNPDNWIVDESIIKQLEQECKDQKIPLIHDAVYYNNIYMSSSSFRQIGDAQIYSASKSFGISGIRIGWLTTHDTELYKLVSYYVEAMTTGVSIASQIFLYNLLNTMRGYPTLTEKFERLSYDGIRENKLLIKQVNNNVLEIPSNIEDTAGMFMWTKIKDYSILDRAKINAIDGKYFGVEGFVRMNLALEEDKIKDIVRRLNYASY
jgi:aspartate/methionine/tyrosine aminotransferase